MPLQNDDVTTLLVQAGSGDRQALNAVLPLVYDELRRLARRELRRERSDHTLTTAALVHEAFLKLVDQTQIGYRDRAHFGAICSRAMRQILVDHARRRRAVKRGGAVPILELDESRIAAESCSELVLDLHEALEILGRQDARMARVVECRFFGGMSAEETAEALDLSLRTVERTWTRAKTYLYRALRPGEPRNPTHP